MGRQAERVYSDPATIQRFEALVATLQNGAQVRLRLVDGDACEGVVSERPTLQQFYDGDGNEGTHGVVRLERAGVSDWHRFIWFDQIAEVEHHDADADRRA